MMARSLVRLVLAAAGLLFGGPATAASTRQVADVTIAQARAAMQIDPALARTKAHGVQATIAGISDPVVRGTLRATALWLEGEAAYRMNDVTGASSLLTQASVLVRRYAPGSKLEGDVLISSGSIHGETGQVVAALSEFQRAYAIFLRLKDPRNRAIALICIASLYGNAKDFAAALRYFDQALATFNGDPGLQVSINNNRATFLRDLGRYVEAERGYRAALTIAAGMHSRVMEAQILRNIARVQLRRDDLAGADRTIARGLALAEANDDHDDRRAMLGVAAQAAFQHKRTAAAEEMITLAFDGIDPGTTTVTSREAHETAYRVFRAQGRADLALVHLQALKRLDDRATRLATSSGAALMAARFDFANQELRIARMKAEDLERRVAAEHQRAATQRYVLYGGAGATTIVIAALLAGLVVVRRSRDTVRAANADLEQANVALAKALAAKTEFLATTSHEIRTPLNGILGMTQVMLADPNLPDATRDRIAVVHGAGTTMRALVDDILDVAKMETGRLTLETAPFDLPATILDATRLWEVQAAAKGVAFVRALDDCPRTVAGDAARVRQIVFNLLSNALKFTEAGEIAISARQLGQGGIAIAIRDTGIGIDADKLEAIFESFRQADAGTTRRFGGTGLGLAICRQLARAMGGDVSVESRVGEGSVFTATLPLARVDIAAVAQDSPDATLDGAMLVVDRNPITRSLFRTLLAPHASRIVFAGNAAEAVVTLAGGGIERVLVDDVTVRAAGDAIAALAAIANAAGDAPVALLWPGDDDGSHGELMATGIAMVIPRPVTGPSLVASLFRKGNDRLVRRAA